MKRALFVSSGVSAVAALKMGAADAAACNVYLKPVRVAWIIEDELRDVQFEYDIPGRELVWVGNSGGRSNENPVIGNVPASGVLRYATTASKVVFREAQFAPPALPPLIDCAEIDFEAAREDFLAKIQSSYASLNKFEQDVTVGKVKYALGDDAGAESLFGGVLIAKAEEHPKYYWNLEARIFRGFARENQRKYFGKYGAEHDYSWIIDHPDHYPSTSVAQALIARSRINRLKGDLDQALRDLNDAREITRRG